VPFTEVTNRLHREVSKHWSAATIYGEVPKYERDQIFGDFQQKPDPSVLIAHPQCMSHALTLTEASTIIWYAPIDSNATYEQANGRITRAGQRYVANIIHLAGSSIERNMYKRLQQRQGMQGLMLSMVEKGESFL
jgi:SNF2 family DNA or RNA helicase